MNSLTSDERGLIVTCPTCGQRNRAVYEKLKEPFRCSKCQTTLHLPGQPVEVTTESIFDALTKRSPLPILVDFWAPWCGPCKMIAPELVKAASAKAGKWLIAKVNIDEIPNLASRFQISGIPTMTIFHGGREVARQSGAMLAPAIQQFMASVSV